MSIKPEKQKSESGEPLDNPEGDAQTIADLRAENARLTAHIAELEAAQGGLSGYLITTPDGRYNGRTGVLNFRRGRAFIPDGPEAMALARQMECEFHYHVTHIDNWRELAGSEEMARSFIDMLSIPTTIG
jgi:hypothetical protein